jgi:hypothetical protein
MEIIKIQELFKSLNGKVVSLIDSTNYLLKFSGMLSFNGKMISITKGTDYLELLIDAIYRCKEFENHSETKNFRFYLHNGHIFDIVYSL